MIRFLVLWLLPVLVFAEDTSTWQVHKPGASMSVQAQLHEGIWLFPLAATVRFLGYEDEVCGRCGLDEVYSVGSTAPLPGGRLLVRWFQNTALYSGTPGTLSLGAAPQRIGGDTWVPSRVFGLLGEVTEDGESHSLTFHPGTGAQATLTPVSLVFLPVAVAGLLDGINPCVFTTLVFLVSYLAVAGRSRRQTLAIGAVYTLSVFVTYFLVGLGLFELVRAAQAFPWLSMGLRALVTASLVIFALITFRDALLAQRGLSREMVMTLPAFLRDRVRSAIRTHVRGPFPLAVAALLGFLVTVFELVCTGQIYFPTIAYAVGVAGDLSALRFLLVYNVAFILPLTAVFLLTWWGTGSVVLARWYQRHLVAARLLTGVLFLALAGLMIPGLLS